MKLTSFLSAVILLAALLGGVAQSASGASTSNLRILYSGDDAFRNYDFTSNDVVSSTNVDWPVNLLFLNNADIHRVKHGLGAIYSGEGSTMWGRLNDGYGFVWDADGGRKKGSCRDEYTHYRVYADGDDRLYNMSWGYYVLGTSHIDHHECWTGTWFGRSEVAEGRIAADAAGIGWAVYSDWAYWYNAEPYRAEGNHIWENDGYTTYIGVGGGGGGSGPRPMSAPGGST